MDFTATIKITGINLYVDMPATISRAMGKRGHVPIKGSVNRFPIRATLVPTGAGRHRLYINGEMRKGAGVDTGDRITVSIEPDTGPRMPPFPEALQKALAVNKEAKAVWDRLPPSHRKEYLDYLNWLKTPESLERNVKKVIAAL